MIIEVIVFHIADRLVENPPPVGFMSSPLESLGRHPACIDCRRSLAAGIDGGSEYWQHPTREYRLCQILAQPTHTPQLALATHAADSRLALFCP
jgi:hypothetical protein